MTRRRALSLTVDAAMAILMLWLMSYPVTRGLLRHGVCGVSLAALIIFHHLLNLPWYRALPRGRWKAPRVLTAASDMALFAAFAALTASSLVMAGDVFSFVPFAMPWWGRDLHSFSTAWLFALSFFHLGLHGSGFWNGLRAILGRIMGRVVLPAAISIFAMCLLAFWKSGLWKNMFLLEQAAGHAAPWLFYVQLCGTGAFFCAVGRICLVVLTGKRSVAP
ncbi:MAG: DUF4405 domain-containing protein [Mailhella sp.]|nr:DUF4405 domain-containing protein [Mailhella sp.]